MTRSSAGRAAAEDLRNPATAHVLPGSAELPAIEALLRELEHVQLPTSERHERHRNRG